MDGLSELTVPPLTGMVSLGKGRLSSGMRIPDRSRRALIISSPQPNRHSKNRGDIEFDEIPSQPFEDEAEAGLEREK